MFEILSPSTSAENFGPKKIEYRATALLQAYLIEPMDQTIRIDTSSISLSMKDIYAHGDLCTERAGLDHTP